ncbi:hypothetical protein Ae201684P_005858 [Aphanomyces euteiches]|uniref:Uncharacterized protein n=1 Tax=Aphanomyces euteiches TaxID=100861 RepID=A0A6G0WW53_9STRA|nr:hypothetical protein Ae201684_011077 [Aphanomyces euteiches]KAH9058515.1 hypothetical protein Ae201684P_005858 [Aphanomyces euteiches]
MHYTPPHNHWTWRTHNAASRYSITGLMHAALVPLGKINLKQRDETCEQPRSRSAITILLSRSTTLSK